MGSITTTCTEVVLAERPSGDIIPGETFSLKQKFVPQESDLKDGEVLLKCLYLSMDPAMRGWLRTLRSYVPNVEVGDTMRGSCVGVVKASKLEGFPVGTLAVAPTGWTEMAIVGGKRLQKVEIPEKAKVTDALGVLGLTGLTAYFGILDVGKVKEGDFVVISGAAGATGSIVGQIAKLKGAKVLGLAGSDDKVRWLTEELEFDYALNYKDDDFADKFRSTTKNLIDVFFDNVGGEILDLALKAAKPHARFVMCGGISQYNVDAASQWGPKNYLMIITMRIRMEGFVVLDYMKQWGSATRELAQWLAEGKIQRKETIIKGGLKNAENALIELYNGGNTGKLLVEISADPEADIREAKSQETAAPITNGHAD